MELSDIIITGFHSCLYFRNNTKKDKYIDNKTTTIVAVTKGKLQYYYNGKSYVADPENSLYLPANISYTFDCVEPTESVAFKFIAQNAPKDIMVIPPGNAYSYYKRIQRARTKTKGSNRCKLIAELYSLIDEITNAKVKFGKSDILFNDAVKIILQNFHKQDFKCSYISEQLHISDIYLRKLFQSKENTSPNKYITKIRMEKALEMLKENYTVGEVALSVGYSDSYYFSRAFKNHYGTPPSHISKR